MTASEKQDSTPGFIVKAFRASEEGSSGDGREVGRAHSPFEAHEMAMSASARDGETILICVHDPVTGEELTRIPPDMMQ